jgi:site-specific recombinase XerC
MIRRRYKPDGLPFRVYERKGARVYSIGYKLPNGKWAFRYSCSADDAAQITENRRKAITEAAQIGAGVSATGPTEDLIDAWFAAQDAMPLGDPNRRAESTLTENRREAKNLRQAFGHMAPGDITKTDGYAYLDACVQAKRAGKGNKEISLLQVILEYGVRNGVITSNPLAGIRKNKTVSAKRYVSDADMALAVEVGRAKGATRHIVALALRTAYLCVRRSVEVRGITRDAITDAGMVWHDGKPSASVKKPPVLIEWTPELRSTITEALQIKRHHVAGTIYLFGNMRGQRYTKGGWKAVLDDLMQDCEKLAAERGVKFQRFSLQDCRPKGATDKLDRGHTDAKDALGHTTDRMLGQVYDRRQFKRATPAR